MAQAPIPPPEDLLKDLRVLVRSGVRPASLPAMPTLLGLAIVGVRAHGTRPVDRALALVKVVREAADELGEGPSGEAVRLVLGLLPRSRGLLLKERRDLAAEHLGIDVATWRKGWEQPLLLELATELYRMESEQAIVVHVRPKSGRGPVLDEFRQGRGGKSLDRREAEARLFSLMYALRADLLAVSRIRSGGRSEEEALPFLHSSLWRFAQFVEAMARFMDTFGSAIVMAGNEVTVREAASLLGWKPPFDDEEIGFLRIVLGRVRDGGCVEFVGQLEAEERGRPIVDRWHEARFGP